MKRIRKRTNTLESGEHRREEKLLKFSEADAFSVEGKEDLTYIMMSTNIRKRVGQITTGQLEIYHGTDNTADSCAEDAIRNTMEKIGGR